MHEKLIKSLRACAEINTKRVCFTCPWALHQKGCITAMVTAAADAIEELTEDNAALNGTVANLLEQIKDLAGAMNAAIDLWNTRAGEGTEDNDG